MPWQDMQQQTILILNASGPANGETPDALRRDCAAISDELGLAVEFAFADGAQALYDGVVRGCRDTAAVIVDPGTAPDAAVTAAYRYALRVTANRTLPFVELREFNIFAGNEDAVVSPYEAVGRMGLVAGFGRVGYALAIHAVARRLGLTTRGGADTETAGSARTRTRIGYINGPNLNLLGTREPEIYGSDTLENIAERCRDAGARTGYAVDFLQSNHEGQIVDWIQATIGTTDALIVNAGAYTHTSIAIHDALRAYDGFAVELHISNPHARETFRHRSYVATAVDAVVLGLGPAGYELLVPVLGEVLRSRPTRAV
jgi:3-dehydroquinate dehydratase-2